MKLLILAAGKGTRLMPLTKNTPKSLLHVGEGFTLVETQLMRVLKSGGVSEVIIVVGYCADQIKAKLKNFSDIPIRFVYNPFYETTNNLLSFWFATPYLGDDFIMLSGDYIFKAHLLRNLIDVPREKEIVTVIHKKGNFDADEVKVILDGDTIVKTGKDILHPDADARALSMIRFVGGGRTRILETLNEAVKDSKNQQSFYLTAMQSIMDEGHPVHYLECEATDWAEVDHLFDLESAQSALRGKLRGFLLEKGLKPSKTKMGVPRWKDIYGFLTRKVW